MVFFIIGNYFKFNGILHQIYKNNNYKKVFTLSGVSLFLIFRYTQNYALFYFIIISYIVLIYANYNANAIVLIVLIKA